jgi:hypothetical protein
VSTVSAATGPAAAEQPGQWSQLHTMLAAAAAVDTAGRLGILDRLQQTPATAGEIAQHCATAPDLTDLLLDALDALNVVQRSDDGRYTTTSAAQWLSTLGAGWSRLAGRCRPRGWAAGSGFTPATCSPLSCRIPGYDLIILGNVCHLFSPDTNRALLRRLRPALRDGGTLAIVDALPSAEPGERRPVEPVLPGLAHAHVRRCGVPAARLRQLGRGDRVRLGHGDVPVPNTPAGADQLSPAG